MTDFENNIKTLNSNIDKIDDNIQHLSDKSIEIKKKIEMLMNKVHLKLEDSTQLLQFQQSIILNETNYLKNLKHILLTNINTQLYDLSENISFLTMSIVNIYKDIPNSDSKLIPMTNKNDDLGKIISNISHNLSYISEILVNFKKYNESLNSELLAGNFHCKTLKNDMENTYNHIHTEYNKYVFNASQKMDYYVEFSNNISEQIDKMTIAKFYN
jgi:predicted  nucleic acid-binding Zn-ribbon protein